LRGVYLPPRHVGITILAILAVFLGGLVVGSVFFGSSEPAPTAADEVANLNTDGAR
jgi:hypothetical protein